MITYQQIVPELMSLVPELRKRYLEMSTGFGSNFTSSDVEELQQVQKLHDLQNEKGSLGSTIVFENLLVPYVLEISEADGNRQKLTEIMNWIENLSNSGVFEVSNLVAGSFCEPLLASHEDKLSRLYPSIGLKTKELFKMQFARFVVTDETKKNVQLDKLSSG